MDYEGWCTDFLSIILSQQKLQSRVSEFIAQIDEIRTNGKLLEPFSSETEDFINIFSHKIIDRILAIKPSSNAYANMLNSILQSYIKLSPNYIFSENQRMMNSVYKIITASENLFYDDYTSGILSFSTNTSPLFNENRKLFTSTNYLSVCNDHYSSDSQFVLEIDSKVLEILLEFQSNWNEDLLMNILENYSDKLIAFVDKLNGKKIRDANDKSIMHCFSLLIDYLGDSTLSDDLIDSRFELCIRMLKSEFLSKQFSALQVLMAGKPLTRNQIDMVRHEFIIDSILENLHQETIHGFAWLFKSLLRLGHTENRIIESFWFRTITQPSYCIEYFTKEWNTIVPVIPDDQIDFFWKTVSNSKILPIQVLQFLIDVKEHVPEANKLDVFHRLFNSSDNQTKNYSDILCKTVIHYIPNDEATKQTIQNMCLSLLEENRNVAPAMSCLKLLCKDFDQEHAQVIVRKIINNAKNLRAISTYLLDLISALLGRFNSEITMEDYNLIKKCFNSSLDVAPEHLEKFLNNPYIVSNNILNLDMKINYFQSLTRKKSLDPGYIKLVFTFFNLINKSNFDSRFVKCQTLDLHCIDGMWVFLNTTGSQDVVERICQIYNFSSDPKNIEKFIEQVTKDPIDHNKINCLETMMIKKESLITGRNQNRWDNDSTKQKVPVTGDFTGLLLLPETIASDDLKKIFSEMFGCLTENLTLKIDKKVCFGVVNLSNQTMIEIKTKNSLKFENIIFPSQVLSKSGLYRRLLPFLSSGDEKIEEKTLNVLNMLPTIKEIIDELNSEKPPWQTIFNKSQKSKLSYYLMTIGKLTSTEQYTNKFFVNGGVMAFFDTLFYDKDFCGLSLITKILQTILTAPVGPAAEIERGTMLANLSKEKVIFIYDMISELVFSDENAAEKIFNFVLLAGQTNSDIVENPSLFNLIKSTIFHKNQIFRNLISKLVHLRKVTMSDFLPFLTLSKNSYCTVYFNILKECSMKGTKEDFTKIVSFFKEQFPSSNEFIDQLDVKYMPIEFIDGIINSLIMFPKESMSDQLKLMKFIVNNVLLNSCHFYNVSSIYRLLIELSKDDTSVKSELLKILSVYHKSFDNENTNQILMNHSENKFRGLKNLGATCYMNSALQVLFNIPEFSNTLLESNIKKNKDEWLERLQILFAKMKYFPDSVIDTSKFAEKWLDFDKQPIDVSKQEDSLEFLQMVLDKANDNLPGIANKFTGQIVSEIKGVTTEFKTETYENFTVFAAEIENKKDFNDLFSSFLSPNTFSGSNKYLAEGIGKIDATQTQFIKILPEILIIQLKRFNFDMSLGQRQKISSSFEYPLELDLSQITKQDNEEEDEQETKYKLESIICHYGTAQSGHYISYIKKSVEADDEKTQEKWFLFNDSLVSEFKGDLVKETKGTESMHYEVSWGSGKPSAYVLIYRRNDVVPEKLKANKISKSVIDVIKPMLSKAILFNILTSNEYCEFILEVCDEGDILFEYLTKCLTTITKSKILDLIQNKLQNLANGKEFANYILSKYDSHFNCLLKSPSKEMRNCYAEVLCRAMQTADSKDVEEMLNYLTSKFDEIMKYWQNFDEFFLPFLQSVTLSCSNESKLIPLFFDFLVKTIPEYANQNKEFSYQRINLSSVFKLLFVLLSSPQLRSNYQKTVFNSNFLDNWFQSTYHALAFSQLLRSFVIENKDLSQTFFDFFSQNADQLSPQAAAGHFSVIIASNTDQTSSQIGWVFKFLLTKSDNYITQFLSSLEEKITESHIDFINAVLNYVNIWCNNWLFSENPFLRKETKKFVINVFDSQNANQRVSTLVDKLLEKLPELSKLCLQIKYRQDFVQKQIPATTFYKLLKWCSQKQICYNKFVEKSKLLCDNLIQIKNLRSKHFNNLLELIIKTIPSQVFFRKVDCYRFLSAFDSFRSFSDETIDIAINSLNYARADNSLTVSSSVLLQNAINSILLNVNCSSLKSYQELNLICRSLVNEETTANNVAKFLFGSPNFHEIFDENLTNPLDLTLYLLREYPETSLIFMQSKANEFVHKFTLENMDVQTGFVVLREWTDSFKTETINKRDWFRRPLIQPIILFWQKSELISEICQRLTKPFTNIHDSDEMINLLVCLAMLSPSIASIVISELSKSKEKIDFTNEKISVLISMAVLETPESSISFLTDIIPSAPAFVKSMLSRALARVKAIL
ncbi:Clan CA, family C19, ubiquitin hydrolase-like cysteine peptidase [Trichomonas vaginalis G3]|uniref:Clan CA, family C19, ubiquitin hydrolase-like cysteine peptidase n=1 Tax=Trichomonas vaginalis (strain ATCC PRA-98 / G3) TaxID=412133 RepID=A2FK80_TRIV3|nr:ubiquitinyl hydrolase protein [Trichomonas vaginalis G3]EAX94686.1 Clan CA, family C19, ubiquitin hydrolase-like cysteine peptidase [Trichomonas vaginalis G3]KAI5489071.1 ubiquitinyl hydrolase protein [Trichomonas vaginalis G3]|eukprot:XP_001307616.1 Clan CA, family C19, ubiquitin hydrolase-like cysteine peptidase [Trichomonas vaginalis G3]